MLVVSTAHWAKFGADVYKALAELPYDEVLPDGVRELTGVELLGRVQELAGEDARVPKALAELDERTERFTSVVEPRARRHRERRPELAPLATRREKRPAGHSRRAPGGNTMKAVVVYESLWGNTAPSLRSIAEGSVPTRVALTTDEATGAAIQGADLIVAGAPLLGFNLPTEDMRAASARTWPDLARPRHPSMRSWLETVPAGTGRARGFETRIWWSPGSSAKKISAALRAKGYSAAGKDEKFIVTGKYGPLKDGEIERARQWGAKLRSRSAEMPGHGIALECDHRPVWSHVRRHREVLQRFLDSLFRDSKRVSRLDVICAPRPSTSMPSSCRSSRTCRARGAYTRQRLADQLNSAIVGHGLSRQYGTVD